MEKSYLKRLQHSQESTEEITRRLMGLVRFNWDYQSGQESRVDRDGKSGILNWRGERIRPTRNYPLSLICKGGEADHSECTLGL